MKAIVPAANSSVPVRKLDSIRPAQAKAELRTSETVAASDYIGPSPFGRVIWDALLRHYGSVKAIALSLDVDPSLIRRELETGKFKIERLEHCEPAARAAIASAFSDAYSPLSSPADRIREDIREARRRLDAIEQGIDFLEK